MGARRSRSPTRSERRTLSTRGATILDRFPRHLDARRGRQARSATWSTALATELDVQTSQLGQVRRGATRSREAEQERDLLLLAGFDGFDDDLLDVLRRAGPRRHRGRRGEAAGAAADADLTLVASTTGTAADAFTRCPTRAPMSPARAPRLETALARGRALRRPGSTSCRASRRRRRLVLARQRHGRRRCSARRRRTSGSRSPHVEHEPDGYWHLASAATGRAGAARHAPGDPAGGDVLAADASARARGEPVPARTTSSRSRGATATGSHRQRGGFETVPVDGDRARLGRPHRRSRWS